MMSDAVSEGGPSDRYAGRAEAYEAHRLAYAPRALEELSVLTGLTDCWTVADVGSGTGRAGRGLLGRVRLVLAVEPSEDMRRVAVRELGDHAAFRSIAGSAERTTLEDRCADLVLVGQALHWFDRPAALAEFGRILRPGGQLATVWNRFDGQEIVDVSSWFRDGTMVRRSLPMRVSETWEQYLGGATSAAGAPLPGQAGYVSFVARQRESFDAGASGGVLTVRYWTELAVGLPAAAPGQPN